MLARQLQFTPEGAKVRHWRKDVLICFLTHHEPA